MRVNTPSNIEVGECDESPDTERLGFDLIIMSGWITEFFMTWLPGSDAQHLKLGLMIHMDQRRLVCPSTSATREVKTT